MGVGGAPIQTMSAKGQNMVKCWEWCESKRKICSISSKQSSQWDREGKKGRGRGKKERERNKSNGCNWAMFCYKDAFERYDWQIVVKLNAENNLLKLIHNMLFDISKKSNISYFK